VGVTDGSAIQTFDLTVVVTPEDSTVAYTGPTRVVGADPDADQVPVTLTAQVTQAADGSPGALDAATVTFTDTIGDEDLCTATVTSAGTAGCTFAADLSADSAVNFHVALVVGGSFHGASTSDATLVVELPDVPPPDTTITSGPSGWLMAPSATFGLRSSAPDATYVCRLDAVRVPCAGGSATVAGLAAGTHRFTAAAVDDVGERDDTPAVRDFAVPVDDAGLGATGRWKRKRSSTAYLGTYSQARKKAAALTFQVSDARELVLLVQTGKRYGAVKVFLGGSLLATVRTAGPAGARAVRIGHFSAPRSGTLRIVATSRRTVRIDGLGVSTAAF
jgi:hypothetical protein